MERNKPLGKVLTKEQKENIALQKRVDALEKLIKGIAPEKLVAEKTTPAEDIPLNKQIRVMSLCNNKLNLSTEEHGLGHRYSFEKFGDVKKISYADILAINQKHNNFLEAGYYYILDDRVVEEEGLESLYQSILNKEKIELVLNNGAGALEFFQQTNPKQQKIIVDMIVQKMINDEFVDFNLINNVDRVYNANKDPKYIDIATRVKNTKEVQNIKNE